MNRPLVDMTTATDVSDINSSVNQSPKPGIHQQQVISSSPTRQMSVDVALQNEGKADHPRVDSRRRLNLSNSRKLVLELLCNDESREETDVEKSNQQLHTTLFNKKNLGLQDDSEEPSESSLEILDLQVHTAQDHDLSRTGDGSASLLTPRRSNLSSVNAAEGRDNSNDMFIPLGPKHEGEDNIKKQTLLSLLVQNEKYQAAIHHLRTKPREARVCETPQSGEAVNSRLPLHSACVKLYDTILGTTSRDYLEQLIVYLVLLYPRACQIRDSTSMRLPLHSAIWYGCSSSTLSAMLLAYPKGLDELDVATGCSALDLNQARPIVISSGNQTAEGMRRQVGSLLLRGSKFWSLCHGNNNSIDKEHDSSEAETIVENPTKDNGKIPHVFSTSLLGLASRQINERSRELEAMLRSEQNTHVPPTRRRVRSSPDLTQVASSSMHTAKSKDLDQDITGSRGLESPVSPVSNDVGFPGIPRPPTAAYRSTSDPFINMSSPSSRDRPPKSPLRNASPVGRAKWETLFSPNLWSDGGASSSAKHGNSPGDSLQQSDMRPLSTKPPQAAAATTPHKVKDAIAQLREEQTYLQTVWNDLLSLRTTNNPSKSSQRHRRRSGSSIGIRDEMIRSQQRRRAKQLYHSSSMGENLDCLSSSSLIVGDLGPILERGDSEQEATTIPSHASAHSLS